MMAKRMRRLLLIPALVPILLLISCGSEQQSSQQQSYKDTKTMVIDVLKTEEAQKAIQEATAKNKDKTLQLLSTGEGQQIQLAVKDILTTEGNGSKLLEQTMSDPKFAGDFAKAAQKNLKQMHKDLLKDPEYQKSMFEALDNPDYQKIILETMKGQKYRQQMMDVIRESLQSPLFKADLIQMFQKAIQEETKPKEQKAQGDGGGGGQSGGEQSGEEGGDQQKEGGEQSGGDSGGDGDSGGGEEGGDQQKKEEEQDKKKQS